MMMPSCSRADHLVDLETEIGRGLSNIEGIRYDTIVTVSFIESFQTKHLSLSLLILSTGVAPSGRNSP